MLQKIIILICILAGTFISFLTFFIIFFDWNFSSNSQVLSCEATASEYQEPYCVSIISNSYLNGKRHYIFISAGKNNPYGELINYPESVAPDIKQITTEWSKEGLKITMPLTYELFVPREKFSAGR